MLRDKQPPAERGRSQAAAAVVRTMRNKVLAQQHLGQFDRAVAAAQELHSLAADAALADHDGELEASPPLQRALVEGLLLMALNTAFKGEAEKTPLLLHQAREAAVAGFGESSFEHGNTISFFLVHSSSARALYVSAVLLHISRSEYAAARETLEEALAMTKPTDNPSKDLLSQMFLSSIAALLLTF